MAQQDKYFVRKSHRRKVDQTEPRAGEVKILNTEQDKLQNVDCNTLLFNVRVAAAAYKNALRKIKFEGDNYKCTEVQKKEIIKELADVQNMTKLKLLSLKSPNINKTQGESIKTAHTQPSTQSLIGFVSELTGNKSSPPQVIQGTGDNFVHSKSEAFSTSKLMSLSKQSLCSTRSSQIDYSDVDDVDDDDDDDDFDDEKFKAFALKVDCPFCLKHEDNRDSLAKHLDAACSPFKTKTFVQDLDCPYSVFQLSPHNKFKCNICPGSVQSNLKKYFMHLQSPIHISGYNKSASRKNYTDFIFCASCKVQIPNNVSSILFHLEHKVHERNRKNLRSSRFFRQRGIQCVYSKEKKFKCLSCPPGKSIHKSVKGILGHVESEAHKNLNLSQKKNTYTVYCMFCLEEVNVFNVILHFASNEHVRKEEEENDNKFQLCFYCGFKCSKLLELARHTEVCLDKFRQKDRHPESEGSDKVLGQIEKEKDQERPTKENTSEKGRSIIVKGYPKILDLYHYFKQFGPVLEIEPHGENTVMIKFQEEKTVDRILESGKSIEINGVNAKITREEDLDRSEVKAESSRAAEGTNPPPVGSNDGSDLAGTSRDDFGVSSPTVFSKIATDNGDLESLFNRVSSHLSYTAIKPDCEDFLSIAGDCGRILKLGNCYAIGFLKCGLTFPVEKITLYCELSNSFIKEGSPDDKSTSLTESILFNENLCQKCVSLFTKADGIGRVKLRENSFPLVEFYHNKTQKLCTITFRQSDNILAEELRYCLKDNEKLRSFVLIIRFWFSVHKLEVREFESTIISLLLFFILSSGVVKTPSENFSKRQKGLLLNYCARIQGPMARYRNLRKEYTIVELFQNFLLFLNDFDFENLAICLPLLQPVPKTKLSQEPLKKYLCKWFSSDAPVWIMDPFLFNNVAVDVKKADWDLLLKTVRETIEHYHIQAKT